MAIKRELKREVERTLKNVFGFNSFKPNQREVVEAILEDRDVFVSMPTGGGKSLCYQLSALLLDSLTVVVSPLIALMQDQVGAARELGISAEFINSSLEPEDARDIYRRLFSGKITLLYISPERFSLPRFQSLLEELKPSLFVIDEAHCISEWGHDFRPDYLSLSLIRKRFPDAGLAAFTATATKKVQKDIVGKLKMKEPFVLRASFDRPELFYRVRRKEKPLDQILSFVLDRPGKAGIIYRTRRKDVEETGKFLRSHGIRALPYHAGLPDIERKRNQERFVKDEADVIVATIAFGMGIDKSNIRFVVHGDLPKSLEAYYQETGRAGRDGLLSHCLLLYTPGDIGKIRYFIDQIEDAEEASRSTRNLETMVGYAESGTCRRKVLLNHFDEKHSGECSGCDICTDASSTEDMTVDAQKLLSAVARTGERFGSGQIVDIVKGADTQKIRQWGHNRLRTYGVGGDKPKKHWSVLVEELVGGGALVQGEGKYPTLELSDTGRDILFGRKPFMVVRRRERKEKTILLKKRMHGEGELFALLRKKRLEISHRIGNAPYMVFSDATLEEIAEKMPRSPSEFLSVTGVGRKKLKQYGDEFLEVVNEYLGG
ncbi:MAG: DNA helicase RecQ [Spirochaetaceae bacterium]